MDIQKLSPVPSIRSDVALHSLRVWNLELAAEVPHGVWHAERDRAQYPFAGLCLRPAVRPRCRYNPPVACIAAHGYDRVFHLDGRNHLHGAASDVSMDDRSNSVPHGCRDGPSVPYDDRDRGETIQEAVCNSDWIHGYLRF